MVNAKSRYENGVTLSIQKTAVLLMLFRTESNEIRQNANNAIHKCIAKSEKRIYNITIKLGRGESEYKNCRTKN